MNLLFIDGEVVEAATETIANEEIITIADESAAAEATAAQPAPAGSGSFWIMIIAMIAIMYFFMWRPESKRRKQMENFRNGLKKGDRIITAGGIYGTVKEVHPTSLLIEVDSNVTLRIDKNMVAGAPTQQA
ncbi:MAG: preprotein translocase subunit YajC [Alistipes sp.]|nr:preprotein translocase subunit YajC [Alistipes sp.]